ncbi:MAG: ATP-binding cassette domain-containing protein [Pseudomonadota bacterium]
MSAPEAAIAADGLTKRFAAGGRRATALAGVSLRVRPGVVTGLIGPDGAGKTTFMRLAAGLLAPDAGKIEVLGLDATRDALAVQAQLGYMPQRFGLYEDLSVQENLDLYADLQGIPPAARPERYRELMHMTGLAAFTARLAGRLSGGMKQKLGLACTLVRAPRLLLLDEPTVGVDPVSRRELWSIVYRLVQDEGMSVLLSTAYLDEAERCDEVALLHEGRMIDQGRPGDMSARMQGRTFTARAAGMRSRELQAALARHPEVVDAVVQGDRVRLVARSERAPDAAALLPDTPTLQLDPATPRFEDSFVARLQREAPAPGSGNALPPRRPARAEDAIAIRVAGLSRRFGNFYAVRDVSFEVQRGEIFGLLGANGAGKSTTFRMLCGLLPASAGTLRVAGLDLRQAAAAARARIGYMSQKFSLYGNLTVRQNLAFFAGAYGLTGRAREERLAWALAEFELDRYAGDPSAELPLGYKQRLAMACALMHAPDILFLDEPTSGVDPLARREFWERINALARAGVTVMVTTHFMEEAEYCDRLAIMAAGRLLAVGEPADIKARAHTAAAPEPTMEDAFIRLIQNGSRLEATA